MTPIAGHQNCLVCHPDLLKQGRKGRRADPPSARRRCGATQYREARVEFDEDPFDWDQEDDRWWDRFYDDAALVALPDPPTFTLGEVLGLT
jgi:hypothetical protein